MTALDLRCCSWVFSISGEQGYSLGQGLLVDVASLIRKHKFGLCGVWASVVAAHKLSSCGTWTLLPHSMWDLPGPWINLVSPTLQGGLLTTGPPGKPSVQFSCVQLFVTPWTAAHHASLSFTNSRSLLKLMSI